MIPFLRRLLRTLTQFFTLTNLLPRLYNMTRLLMWITTFLLFFQFSYTKTTAYVYSSTISILNPNILYKTEIVSIPSIFGAQFTQPGIHGPVVLIKNNGCSMMDYPVDLPALPHNLPYWIPDQFYTSKETGPKYIGIVTRGGCPFDVKVFNAQLNGLSGIVIYNNNSGNDETLVRMSADRYGEQIGIYSFFVTKSAGKAMVELAKAIEDSSLISSTEEYYSLETDTPSASDSTDTFPLWISIEPDRYGSDPFDDRDRLSPLFSNAVFIVIVIVLCTSSSLLLLLLVSMIRRYIMYGRLDGLGNSKNDVPPALKKINFPLLTWNDELVKKHKDDCCAICIDEFCVGDKVRELPCLHRFHDTCVDPWLLKHNRLCPTCKQDVSLIPDTTKDTPTKPIIKTSHVLDSETGLIPEADGSSMGSENVVERRLVKQDTRLSIKSVDEGDGSNSENVIKEEDGSMDDLKSAGGCAPRDGYIGVKDDDHV